MEHTRAQRLVIGISGGLDSTLALLICSRACRALKRPASDILAVTMPGFGTTDRTHDNAVTMCRLLGVELREIPISECCLRHFADIGHDPAERTTTYENVQARERTQILMDLANKTGGWSWEQGTCRKLPWDGAPTMGTTCPCTRSTAPFRKR